MDTVIKQISEIESAAASVMDSANEPEKAFAEEMAEKTAAFDRELDSENRSQTAENTGRNEVEMDSKLSKQKSDANSVLTWMEKNYENHHLRIRHAAVSVHDKGVAMSLLTYSGITTKVRPKSRPP